MVGCISFAECVYSTEAAGEALGDPISRSNIKEVMLPQPYASDVSPEAVQVISMYEFAAEQ